MNTMNEHDTNPAPGADEFGDAGGPVGDIDPDAIASASDHAAELEARIEELTSRYQRALADFQNYQRRAVENEREARRQGVTSVVSHLLAVLDNFDLALKIDPEKVTGAQILQGVSMVRAQMLQALGAIDVRPVEPAPGDEFDPRRHEAVVQVEAPGIAPGRIASSFQAGYALGERVLRPAKVAVARPPAEANDPTGATPPGH
ncbi:MAG TPA: nucleotide exchange factor GrpE [Phycisphaerales bacterium]|nr:nucleotide exchange factor GrpE [Phycisphaerales bacterium]